jgi:outer membrane receptor protein involved in Fe transport
LRTGATASQYGRIPASPAGQYNTIQGGNPNLDPETAKTYTFGAVLQYPNWSATVDYWHYNVENLISIIQPQQALTNCVNSGLNCDLIHRELSPNGNLWVPNSGYVLGTNLNIGGIKTDGIDVSFNYNQPIDTWGSLGFTLLGTWVNQYIIEPIPGLGTYDCAGLYGPSCGVPLPEWKHRIMAVWNTPWNVNAAITWRYIGPVDLTFANDNPLISSDFAPSDAHIGSQNYFDLAVQWNATKNFTIRAGVNNIFDKDPPLVSSTAGAFPAVAGPSVFGNGNTFPQVYDTLGRNLFLNVTAKF